jgi:hypothetical protein
MAAWRQFWCPTCKYKTPHEQRGQVGRVKNPQWRTPGAPWDTPEFLYANGLPWQCERCATVTHHTAYQASTAERCA